MNVSPTYTVNESGKHKVECNMDGFDSIINSGGGRMLVASEVLLDEDVLHMLEEVLIIGDEYNGMKEGVLATCNSGFCNRMTRNVGTADIVVVL